MQQRIDAIDLLAIVDQLRNIKIAEVIFDHACFEAQRNIPFGPRIRPYAYIPDRTLTLDDADHLPVDHLKMVHSQRIG